MSNIPLRPIRNIATRRVNGYSPLNDTEAETIEANGTHIPMSATGTLSNKAKGKKRVRYNDEPNAEESENIGLLAGEGELEGDVDDGWKEVVVLIFESRIGFEASLACSEADTSACCASQK